MRMHKAALGSLTAAVCLLTIAACGTGATASDSSVTTAGRTDAACVTSQLKITLTRTGALAGQAGGYLRFTDDSRVTCSLTGWPVVTGLTADGRATRFRHARSTMYGAWQYSAPLQVLTLRPGESGYAVVAADDLPVGARTSCPAPDVRLRVAAPGSKSTALISAWLPGVSSYLPTCTSITGMETGETSAITTLAKLAH